MQNVACATDLQQSVSILALDIGDDECGFVSLSTWRNQGYMLIHGVWDLRPGLRRHTADRYQKFEQFVSDYVGVGASHVAYVSRPHQKNAAAASTFGGYTAVLSQLCKPREVPCVGLDIACIRKYSRLRHNATADEMCKMATLEADAQIGNVREAGAVLAGFMHWMKVYGSS